LVEMLVYSWSALALTVRSLSTAGQHLRLLQIESHSWRHKKKYTEFFFTRSDIINLERRDHSSLLIKKTGTGSKYGSGIKTCQKAWIRKQWNRPIFLRNRNIKRDKPWRWGPELGSRERCRCRHSGTSAPRCCRGSCSGSTRPHTRQNICNTDST
jgi:hypothetical protein